MSDRPTLAQAVEAMLERKEAAQGGVRRNGEDATLEVWSLIVSGLDLNVEEAAEVGYQFASSLLKIMMETGVLEAQNVASLWVDGLATGLLLADLRQRAEAKA